MNNYMYIHVLLWLQNTHVHAYRVCEVKGKSESMALTWRAVIMLLERSRVTRARHVSEEKSEKH